MSDSLPRPVYIEPQTHARVTLEDRALCVEIPGRAETWLPLSRVSRLSISRAVQMDMDAILACARRGIVIVVHDDERAVMARVIGQGSQLTGLRQRLMDFTERPDWYEEYRTWRLAMGRRIALVIARRFGLPDHMACKLDRLQGWIQGKACDYVGDQGAGLTARIYRQQCLAWAQQCLVQYGVDATGETWLVGKPDLADDIGALLALRIEPARLGWLHAMSRRGGLKHPLKRKAIIRKTEQLRPRMEKLGMDIVNRLHIWLMEVTR